MKLEDQRTTIYKVDPNHPETADLPTLRTEELLLNMGPQHPATHGVLKVIMELEGERLVKSTPVLGYLHRGVEKLAEGGTYQQFIPHTDRLDYICAMYTTTSPIAVRLKNSWISPFLNERNISEPLSPKCSVLSGTCFG